MKIKEYIEYKAKKEAREEKINKIMRLLHIEMHYPYDIDDNRPVVLSNKSSQPYADTIYNILGYYRNRNKEITNLVLFICEKYGNEQKRTSYDAQSKFTINTITLSLPTEVKHVLYQIEYQIEKEKKQNESFAKKIRKQLGTYWDKSNEEQTEQM